MNAPATNRRTMLLRQLHARVRNAGIAKEDYRDKIERLFAVRSAADLSDEQLVKAVEMFHVKQSSREIHPHQRKVKALWIAAWNLAALSDGGDRALDAFVVRQTGKQSLRFVTPVEANTITEALKAICARDGFVVPTNDHGGLKARRALLSAQWAKLNAQGKVGNATHALDNYVSKAYLQCHGAVANLTAEQLDDCARRFGAWLRKSAP